MNTKIKLLASFALVALVCVGAIALAQTSGGGDDDEKAKKVEKKIEIVEENGVKTMTVTTTTDGVTTVETFSGDEVDTYLSNEGNSHSQHFSWQGNSGVSNMNIFIQSDSVMGTHNLEFEAMMEEMMKNMEEFHNGNFQEEMEKAMAQMQDMDFSFDFNFEELENGDGGVFVFKSSSENGEESTSRVMFFGDESGENSFTDEDGNMVIKFQGDDGEEGSVVIKSSSENGAQIWVSGTDGEETGTVTIDIDEDITVDENGRKETIIISSVVRIEELNDEEVEKAGDVAESNNDLKVNELKFYPNPTTGMFTLEFDVPKNGPTDIILTDMLGKEIYRDQVNGKGSHTRQIDISGQEKGVYILNLRQGGKSIVKKVVLG